MATALIPSSQHHFDQVGTPYAPVVYDSYIASQSSQTDSSPPLTTTTSDQFSYTSPQRWAAQQVFNRRTSKSPNIRDRTPIRHSRSDMSRHRSSSRPELLYAYAEEQTRQVQQAQQTGTRALFVPSVDAAHSYQPQPYVYPSMQSPYIQQQPYFDPNNTASGYSQLAPQHDMSNHPAMYATPRQEVALPQVAGSALNPSETVYNTNRASSLPSIASVPSNFPPIPQPLESTPNDVDVATSRQKPQCWDHGCNGRQFSTFSNLLRHQREKSGTATKARCPHCGTEFTRTTARNGHLHGGKCKGMPEIAKDAPTQVKEDDS